MSVVSTYRLLLSVSMFLIIMIPAVTGTAETVQYTYDTMGRLVQATHDNGAEFGYLYDRVDNRLQYRQEELTVPTDPALLAFYPFSEGSGETTTDGSGNGNHGTLQGATWTQEGKEWNALSFDRIDDTVITPVNIDQTETGPGATMMAWVYPDSDAAGKQHVISSDDGGCDWSLLRFGSTWQVFTGAHLIDTGFSVDANTWQHVAAVFIPGTGVKFYKNGVETTIADIGYDSSDNPIAIGDNPGPWNEYFAGTIDSVYIYERLLSADEVYAHYEQDAPVALYPFSEGSGTSTADASEISPDGTLVDTSWTTDGKIGNALSFDGTDDYVVIPSSESLNVSTQFTLMAWIYPDVLGGMIISKDGVGSDPTGAYNLSINSSPLCHQ